MAHVRIKPRRSTAAEWQYDNPILASGELAIEVPSTGVGTGLVNMKMGDGVSTWNDLPYAVVSSEEVENQLKTSVFLSSKRQITKAITTNF